MSGVQTTKRSETAIAANGRVDRNVMRDDAATLEEMLLTLAKYGKPRISHDGDGWYCAVDMYVSAAGVNFQVASEFSQSSPMAAVKQCAQRLDKALNDIGA